MRSSLSKVILVLIIIIVIGGGVVLWYLSHLQPSTQTTPPISDTSGVNTNPQTMVTTPSNPNTPASSQTAPLSVGAAYEQLFQSLLAQNPSFISVGTDATGDMASLYALYASDIAESKKLNPSTTDFSIDVATADVNQDGTAEALVYEDLPGFCGSGGCTLDLYEKQQGKWAKIFSTLASGDEIGLANMLTNGYADLFITVPGPIGSEPNVMRFTWNGMTYNATNVVAVWSGSEFQLLSQ